MNNYFVWVACNASGQYAIFKKKPDRDYNYKRWVGEHDNYAQVALCYLEGLGITMPNLTWDSDPIRIEISVKKKWTRVVKHWGRPIMCVETGQIFSSIRDCSKEMGIRYTTIYNCLKRKNATRGYHFVNYKKE